MEKLLLVQVIYEWNTSALLVIRTLRKHNEKDDGAKSPCIVMSYAVVRSLTTNHLTNYETHQN